MDGELKRNEEKADAKLFSACQVAGCLLIFASWSFTTFFLAFSFAGCNDNQDDDSEDHNDDASSKSIENDKVSRKFNVWFRGGVEKRIFHGQAGRKLLPPLPLPRLPLQSTVRDFSGCF